MKITEYAKELRAHDWFYAMSDDHGVWASGERNLQGLRELKSMSSNHGRLFDLASGYHLQMQGAEFEKAWRYAGAHLWINGVKCSDSEAQGFVESKEDPHWGTVHRVSWKAVDDAVSSPTILRETTDDENLQA